LHLLHSIPLCPAIPLSICLGTADKIAWRPLRQAVTDAKQGPGKQSAKPTQPPVTHLRNPGIATVNQAILQMSDQNHATGAEYSRANHFSINRNDVGFSCQTVSKEP
jgi:hypothetical protein